jgi:hypothetical protein
MDKQLKGAADSSEYDKPALEDVYASLANERKAWRNTPTPNLARERDQAFNSLGPGANEIRAPCVLALDQRVPIAGHRSHTRRCCG